MKKYLINGKNFELKKKFNLGELDELNEMSKALFPSTPNIIQGNFTKGTLQRFTRIVLKSDEEIPEEFYSTIEEEQFAEIYADFFLSRIGLMNNMQSSLQS